MVRGDQLRDDCADCADTTEHEPQSVVVEPGWATSRYTCPAGHEWIAGHALPVTVTPNPTIERTNS